MENVEYGRLNLVRYVGGKGQRATEMWKDHFIPAFKKAGLDGPWIMHMQTGKWEAAIYWEMKDGPSSMEWETSPYFVKFRAAFAEQEGGVDKVKALFKEYGSLVTESDSIFGHHHFEPN